MKIIGIYKIISPSGKIYIGQSIDIKLRWDKYVRFVESSKKQRKLYFSFKKHGPENHIFEIIEECNESLLLERETYWKLFYKVLEIPSLCCRLDGKGGSLSQETKNRISKSSLGVSRNKGRTQSEEEKQLRSKIKQGYKPTQEHTENMRKGMLGKNSRPIECINTGEIFKSIKEAAEKYNLHPSSIDNILSGKAFQTRKEKLKFKYH